MRNRKSMLPVPERSASDRLARVTRLLRNWIEEDWDMPQVHELVQAVVGRDLEGKAQKEVAFQIHRDLAILATSLGNLEIKRKQR